MVNFQLGKLLIWPIKEKVTQLFSPGPACDYTAEAAARLPQVEPERVERGQRVEHVKPVPAPLLLPLLRRQQRPAAQQRQQPDPHGAQPGELAQLRIVERFAEQQLGAEHQPRLP